MLSPLESRFIMDGEMPKRNRNPRELEVYRAA